MSYQVSMASVKGVYWFSDSGFAVSDINSALFTHIFCGFADLDPQTHQLTIPTRANALFAQFTATVKLKNPRVKTLLSIGGGGSTGDFASMAAQPASRRVFIESSINLARSYGFSGLDLDWESQKTNSDMDNLGSLLKEWRLAVDSEARTSGRATLLLTAAVAYTPTMRGLRSPVQSINRNLNWINVMAYDFYMPTWFNQTNAPAALHDPSGQISCSIGIDTWIQSGVSANKLVLGMPFYGYAWRLQNANNHGLLAASSGPAGAANDGSMGYVQIKNFIAQSNAPTVYNSSIVTNYCYAGTTWIGYDDTQSIAAKVTYAKQRGLLGYFAWHVGVDNNWALSNQANESWEA